MGSGVEEPSCRFPEGPVVGKVRVEGAPGNTADVAADIGYGAGLAGHEFPGVVQLLGGNSARIGERLAKQLPYLAALECTLALFEHRSLKLLFGQATKALSKADNLQGLMAGNRRASYRRTATSGGQGAAEPLSLEMPEILLLFTHRKTPARRWLASASTIRRTGLNQSPREGT